LAAEKILEEAGDTEDIKLRLVIAA
jgi:hypothetical protein